MTGSKHNLNFMGVSNMKKTVDHNNATTKLFSQSNINYFKLTSFTAVELFAGALIQLLLQHSIKRL